MSALLYFYHFHLRYLINKVLLPGRRMLGACHITFHNFTYFWVERDINLKEKGNCEGILFYIYKRLFTSQVGISLFCLDIIKADVPFLSGLRNFNLLQNERVFLYGILVLSNYISYTTLFVC